MTFDAYQARKRIDSLDGLRAIAVLLVVTVHMHDRVWTGLNGGLGVVIFFALSGFLITTLALREEESRGRLDFGAFYIRRTFRIFPLYYFVLAVYALLILVVRVASFKADVFVHALPYYLLYMQEVPYFRHWYASLPFYQSWTLGIEEKFYLAWPLLAFGILAFAKRNRRLVTAGLILLLVLSPISFASLRWYQMENYAYILMGALLALVLEDERGFTLFQQLKDGTLALLLVALIALQLSGLQILTRSPARTAYAMVFTAILGILVINEGRIQKFLSTPALTLVGELSYGIYLVHILCLNVAEKIFQPGKGLALPAYLLTCLISIVAAYVLHRTIEKPMIRLGKMLGRRALRDSSLRTVESLSLEA